MSIKQVLKSLNLGSIRDFLMSLYHRDGAGRKPYPAVSILKAQAMACSLSLGIGLARRVTRRCSRCC